MATRFTYHPVFDFRHNHDEELMEDDEDLDEYEDIIDEDQPFSLYSTQEDPHDAATQTDLRKRNFSKFEKDDQNLEIKSERGNGSKVAASKKRSGKKERSPRTVQKLMERHRHNERVRHHTLNKRLKAICQHVPGSGEDGRETKVVMMQRIISYIAYLENSIAEFSRGLGLEPDPKLAPLTTKLKKQIAECASMAVVPDIEEGPTSNTNTTEPSTSRRNKLSSPTVDSTSERMVPDFYDPYPNSLESSQDSMAPSSTFFPYMPNDCLAPWLVDGPMITTNTDEFGFFDPVIEEATCQYLPAEPSDGYFVLSGETTAPYETQTQSTSSLHDSMSLFTSPSRLSAGFSTEDSPDFLGESLNDTFGLHGLLDNDPNFINPVIMSTEDPIQPQQGDSNQSSVELEQVELDLNFEEPIEGEEDPSSHQFRNKRKQYKPAKHDPVYITNTDSSSPIINEESNAAEQFSNISSLVANISNVEENGDKHIITHHVPFTWTFHSINDPTSKTVHNIKIEADKYTEPKFVPVNPKPIYKEVKTEKVDHRKTSWMNGFMMYSRLNRRKFINANRGVHTSHISKMMGQTWRAMSSEQQQPYKDKAKQYLMDMKKIPIQEHTCSTVDNDVSMYVDDDKENRIKLEPDDAFQVVPTATETSIAVENLQEPTYPVYNSQVWTYL